jgi:hypothetical protein
MNNGKLSWKVFRVDGESLEKTLNDLSGNGYEIFSVQALFEDSNELWAVVARKEEEEKAKGVSIGFGKKS